MPGRTGFKAPLQRAALAGCWLWVCSLCACGAQLSARKQLADAVQQVSDAARWGRSGTVLGVVSPAYRARFVASRSRWGEEVQMAETEVMEVHQGKGKHSATALVSYSWYQVSTMSLRRTVVQQDWTRERDIYRLQAEQVVRGDPELFASPEGAREGAPRGRSAVERSVVYPPSAGAKGGRAGPGCLAHHGRPRQSTIRFERRAGAPGPEVEQPWA